MYESGPDDLITIHDYGDYIDHELEKRKTKSEENYIYPIGFKSTRPFPSYKYPNSMTLISCEIDIADEMVLQDDENYGQKDVYVFRVTFKDDQENPIEVINSLRGIAAKVNEKYKSKKTSSGLKLFGLHSDYVQYLIRLHIPDACDVSNVDSHLLWTNMNEQSMIDKYVDNPLKRSINGGGVQNGFLYSINKQHAYTKFDPQKQQFYF